MKPLLALSYLNIYLHEGDFPALEMRWLSAASSDEFQAAVLRGLTLGISHRVKGWIGNDTLLGLMPPSDVEWAETTLALPLAQAGLKRFAVCESRELLNRVSLDVVFTHIAPQPSYEVRRFETIAAARAWATGGAYEA